ncbi:MULTISPECIES: tetratricopeptide repeat protein [unclassified Nostoc]|uniref:tetratricopeptide repeat protein n=1 Tax=unclassified Nostoc TaxID=2593658 RepID=UPI002AD3F7D9|nr:tetratricopeptide repeat protein [Nostoc sp. DedQUE03]MDZ7976882.1 tetratricopeptide repeat protein [Nostoc sp. DedQUE03]MDZ8043370.1 tetratricopeptide repeat protein [Nostoc sp. DedQUE02]
MQTLYIKLVPLEKHFVELRYAVGHPARYETQQLDVSSIENLIQKAKGSYYMLMPDLKGIGYQLFCWLDGTGRWLSRAINNCTDEALILALDVRERLGHLPWETLHNGEQFLIERVNPVVVPIRWVDRSVQDSEDTQQRPLRILFMATSLENVEPPLDFEREEAQILTATRDIPLDLRVEESGCIAELSKLWGRYREPFDVFHLTGHASIKNEQPFFITETETGELHAAYASEIASALRFRIPQLVFLSGCRTGEAASDGAVSSLAESLIEQGCRAVLGWGRPIADVVATQAAAYLYSKLAAGYELSEALASTYQYLRKAKVEDWHLLRLYIRGQCPKALVEPLGDQVWLPEEPIYKQFLDSQGIVRVATPQEFVGRRRTLQRSLRVLRTADKLGVILYGLGGVGKSTVAARLLERLQGYDEIFIYRQLDEDKLLRQLAEQCLSATGQEILQSNLPLTQKLTKFLREGLNEQAQRLIFVLDDFEANLELRTDGSAVLKPEAVTVLISLLKAITQSRLPHRIIITSRYDFLLPELNQRFHREQLAALSGTDLQKKCNRLVSFAPGSEIDRELQLKALATSAGNPRLLEWLNKVLQVQQVGKNQILEQVDKTTQEFRESILAEELLNRQPIKLQRMLGFSLVYQLPVPQSAIEVLCPKTFDVNSYISRAVALGLLECIHSQEETLYYVPRIIEPLLDFPKDSIELYRTAAEHLDKLWFLKGFEKSIETEEKLSESSLLNDPFEKSMPTDRLFELYRLATQALNPDLLGRANWFLVMRLNRQGRYREVVTLCKFVRDGAFGHLGIYIISFRLLYYLAKAQEHIGEVEEALYNYQEALKFCSDEYETEKAAILHDLGDLYVKQGNYQQALNICQQVIKIDEKDNNKLGKAKSIGLMANIKRELGEPEEALKLYVKSLELAQKTGDKNFLYALRNNIATLQVDLGQTDAWDNLLPNLVSHGMQSQKLEDKIFLFSNTAMLRLQQGEMEEAREILEYLNDLLPQIDNSWLKALLLHNLATFRSDCGDREIALELYNQALELHRNNGDQPREAMTLQEIGILYERQDNVSEALKFLEDAYQLSLRIGNKDTQAHVLPRIASILIDQDNLDEAEEKLNTALAVVNQFNNPKHHALALREMGRLQIKQKNYNRGANSLRQALEKCSSVVDVVLQATILKLLGEVLSFLGEVDVAIEYLTKSLNIYQKLNWTKDVEEVKGLIKNTQLKKPVQLYQAAATEAEKGNARVALDLLEEALLMIEQLDDEEMRTRILLSMGNLLIHEGDFAEGVKRASQAIEIAKQHNLPEREKIENIALAVQYEKLRHLFDSAQEKCESQKFEEMLNLAHQCLELSEILKDVHWCSEVFSMLGQIKAHQGDYQGGVRDLERAVSLAQENQLDGINELQEIIFTVKNNEAVCLYEQANFAAQQGNIEEAIELARKAYEFQCSINHKNSQPATLGLLGQLLLAQTKSDEGLKQLQRALDIAQELQAQETIDQLQEMISVFSGQIEDQDIGGEQL